ncbi:hypothetical protein L210DRAFT_888934, partial [Boletus edulis BED1]
DLELRAPQPDAQISESLPHCPPHVPRHCQQTRRNSRDLGTVHSLGRPGSVFRLDT